jgi:RloB-like protein
MTRRRRLLIPQRRRIFLGCEGESERGYGALISRLLESQRRDIHLHVVLLNPGGGDPLALIEQARRRILEGERKSESAYGHRAVLMDRDRFGQAPQRDAQIAPIAQAARLRIIWQRPCHEALLLCHLNGCQHLQPATSPQALAELRQRWPDYTKGMPALKLTDWIDQAAIRRAAQVEAELAAFLADIGYALGP